MKWTCDRPGLWTGTDGTNTATAHHCPEGIIHSHEWMWVARLNGEWVWNADTLAEAKAKIADRLAEAVK
jgi:hypothetical protein